MRCGLLLAVAALSGCVEATIGLDGAFPAGAPDGAAGDADAGASDATARDDAATHDAGVFLDSGCPAGTSTVRGTIGTTYFGERATTRLSDLSATPFAALVETSTDGDFDRYEGRGSADGTFEIPCVPDGQYMLEEKEFPTSASYTVTSSRTYERRTYARGRADSVVASSGTGLLIDIAGLDPWRDGGSWSIALPHGLHALPRLELGETSTAGLMVPVPFRLDIAKGDRVTLLQTVTATSPSGQTYTYVSRVRSVALATRDGEVELLDEMLVEPPTGRLSLDWRLPEFAAQASELAPVSRIGSFTLAVESVPAIATGHVPPLPWDKHIEVLTLTTTTADHDVRVELPLPRPVPGERLVVVVRVYIDQFPTSWFPTLLSAPLSDARDVALSVRPELGAPQDLRLNGRRITTGAGATPLLSWTPPSLGRALRYSGFLLDSTTGRVTSFDTPETQFRMPPGRLTPGHPHAAGVSSRSTSRVLELDVSRGAADYGPIVP